MVNMNGSIPSKAPIKISALSSVGRAQHWTPYKSITLI